MSSILKTQQTYSYKPGSDTTNLGSLSKQISEIENDVFRLITNMGLQKKKILICHEEWNLRLRIPLLRCSTSEPQRLWSEQGYFRVEVQT